MLCDFRNTRYCPRFENIREKKAQVVKNIKCEHPRAKNMHAYIRCNDRKYKLEFIDAYNGKCAYCGVSIQIVPKEMFEIDHFIYEKSPVFQNGNIEKAGNIENLILSCHSCNHKKSSYIISDDNRQYLYPDTEEIQSTFVRDEFFYIKITDKCEGNEAVNMFYLQLKLGGEIRRLDYLLMSMIGLKDKIAKIAVVSEKMGQCIEMLRLKRNIMG